MYEQKFKLKSRPFTSTPYVPDYFAAESIHHAMSQAQQCIERSSGPVIVTGLPGTGKSLLLAMLAEQFKTDYNVVALACTRMVNRTDLLQNILFELQLQYRNLSEGELRLSLIDYLKTKNPSRSGMLLLVDEAHSLSPDLLDELRLITNFVRDGRSQVSLVMAGSSALEDHLIETKSESFNQRIAARCYLSNLRQTETFEYILTHIDRAGGNGDELFTGEALKIIHQSSQGCPRVINQICDCSLLLAANAQSGRITADIVRQAWNNVQSIPGSLPMESAESNGTTTNAGFSNGASQGVVDDMMTIEFGQLHDENSQSAEFHPDQAQRNGTHAVAGTQSTRSSTDSNADFGPLHELLDTTAASETRNAACQPGQGTISRCVDSDSQPRMADSPNFENPFEEHFDHEEKINLKWFPIVSEQNLSSLMLTREQLSILDAVEARPAPIIADETTDRLSMFTADDYDNLSHQTFDALDDLTDGENDADSDSELKLTPEEINSLEQIEVDVRRLQREFATSRPIRSTTKSQTTYVARNNQPLEEFMQTWPVPITESKTRGTTDSPLKAESSQSQMRESSRIVNERTDDRDILIVNRPDHLRHSDSLDHVDAQVPTRLLTTGHATRMDYHQLFQQLRQNQ